MSTLVIVESPTKAKTIRNYLPAGYRVEASMGHVRDLPPSATDVPEDVKDKKSRRLGIKVHENFEPIYVVPKDKAKVVKTLKDALREASELVLATDEDREGESISWHLLQLLQPKVPIKRMVFHEITREAIQAALQNCRTIDEKLVHAQETRRILDRLVGYTLSPLLWKKIPQGRGTDKKLSAGRVQSVAVRLLVQRERQRRAFKQGTYWDLKATLATDRHDSRSSFEARLATIGGVKVASGADFDEATGQIAAGRRVVLLNETEAHALQDRLAQAVWQVTAIDERPVTRKPSPPFTTSTLQQEANRKLRLSARDTMRVAQNLYEQGYITYMRTDSVNLSQQAIEAARSCVASMYGPEYLSPTPRQYTTKAKGAQEAHEAIRPAGSSFRTPQQTGLSGREFQLYDLIWKRTVACQMADARQTQITVQIQVEEAGFRAAGKRIDFPGFFRAYVEGSDDPDAAIEDQEVLLPRLAAGDPLACTDLEAIVHETQPPARFTEAALVKTLESEGVGRPSTYATIIGTIIDRGYASMTGQTLVPTFTAFAVTALLERHFPELVDLGFTARMEQTLDEISTGEADWLPYLKQFYLGEAGLENQVEQRESQIDPIEASTILFDELDARIRIGPYGPYVEVETDGGLTKANLPKEMPPADLSLASVQELLRQKIEGPDQVGIYPETGQPIYLRNGPYGPYVQLGDDGEANGKPKRASLPKGMSVDHLTEEVAIGLLSLPRLLGTHPETGGKIQASLGRFGPYIVHDQGKEKEYRSLKGSDNVLTISLDRALALLAEPKAGRGGRGKTAKPLRELGEHPADGAAVNIYDGPYGPYVKHGKINASLPEGQTVETMTLAIAVELLLAKSGAKKTTRQAAGSAAKKPKASATSAKATTAKPKTSSTKTSSTKTSSTKTSVKTSTSTASASKAKTTRKTAGQAKVETTVPPEATATRRKTTTVKAAEQTSHESS